MKLAMIRRLRNVKVDFLPFMIGFPCASGVGRSMPGIRQTGSISPGGSAQVTGSGGSITALLRFFYCLHDIKDIAL